MSDTSERLRWRTVALIFVTVWACITVLHRLGVDRDRGLQTLCNHLYWPETSPARNKQLFNSRGGGRRIPEYPLGTGDAAYGRAQVTAQAWRDAVGLEAAARWPGVAFQTSGVQLFKNDLRLVRARAGNRMGLWIFRQTDIARPSDIYVSHPGGNSGTPFETTIIHWGQHIAVLNVLHHRRDRRLEQFVFWLGEDQPVCRELSEL